MNPGVPNPSIPGESFLDTPIVNGTAYPVLKVDPKAYRFRILNAAQRPGPEPAALRGGGQDDARRRRAPPAPCCATGDGRSGGQLHRGQDGPGQRRPGKPVRRHAERDPDPATKGPDWIQIGTEGGFTPAPVVIPQQPIGYNLDPAYFNFGIVNQHSLFLMPAERADVIVDFSAYAGKTLILYNDSPAPVPAGAAPYDNYTGDGNLMDSGGAPNTQPGYGPNTRTIMQIQVAAGEHAHPV